MVGVDKTLWVWPILTNVGWMRGYKSNKLHMKKKNNSGQKEKSHVKPYSQERQCVFLQWSEWMWHNADPLRDSKGGILKIMSREGWCKSLWEKRQFARNISKILLTLQWLWPQLLPQEWHSGFKLEFLKVCEIDYWVLTYRSTVFHIMKFALQENY